MQRLAEPLVLPAGPNDASALAQTHVRAWRETYSGLLPASYLAGMSIPAYARRWQRQLMCARVGDVTLLAEQRSGVVGYCEGSGGDVHTLYVLRRAQGVGIGRRLLAATARVLAAHGAHSLRLWVLGGNTLAEGFYQHLGAQRRGVRRVIGWGGQLSETAFVWDDIATLTGLE